MLTPLTSVLKKSWGCLKDEGIHETFYRSLHRFNLVSVKHSLDFFLAVFASPLASASSIVDELHEPLLRHLSFSEIQRDAYRRFIFAKDLQTPAWMGRQFERGSRLFAASYQGKVVAVHWAHPHLAELDFISVPEIPLSEGYQYLFGALTSAPFRNCGIGTQLSRFMEETLWREGNRLGLLATFIDNDGARHWAISKGYRYWGRVTYMKSATHLVWRTHLSAEGRRHAHAFKISFENASAKGVC